MSHKRKLYLHIGPHKTGTTVVQSALSNQRLALEKVGIKYCDKFSNGLTAHDVADVISTNQFEGATQALKEVNGIESDVVISSENFSRLSSLQVSFLSNFLADFDVEVIYYIRNPLKRLYSAWQEWVKHGYKYTFPEYISARLINFTSDPEINDSARVFCWKEGFPTARLTIHPYDFVGDIAQHFLKCHMPALDFAIAPNLDKNESYSIEAIETYRASDGAHRIMLQNASARSDFKYTLNLITKRIESHTSEGNFLRILHSSLEKGPFKLIEEQLGKEFPELLGRHGSLFKEKSVEWRYIDPNIWIDDSELANMMRVFKSKFFEKYDPEPFDVRLNQV